MKFIVPTISIQKGGSLEDFYYDLLIVRSDLSKIPDDGNTIVQGELVLSVSQVYEILVAGGEVEQYLMAVKADIALFGDDLPDDLPNRNTLDEVGAAEIRKFKNWFDTSAEVWRKDTGDKIYFLTNPIGTSINKYLKGNEILILFSSFGGDSPSVIDRNLEVSTIAEFQEEIATGWTQVIF